MILLLIIYSVFFRCYTQKKNVSQKSLNQFYLVPIKLNKSYIPIFNLQNLCPFELPRWLIIDTGSSQFWLADSSCQNCSRKGEICPFISEPTKTVSYVKGNIKGSFFYFNLCGSKHQIFCAKQAENMNNIQAQGLLGIKKNSTGTKFFLKLLKDVKPMLQVIISIYIGLNEKKMIIGLIPLQFKSVLVQKSQVNQEINGHFFIFNGIQISSLKRQLILDTGSSLLVLPNDLFHKIYQYIRLNICQACRITIQNTIQCPYSRRYDIYNRINFTILIGSSKINLLDSLISIVSESRQLKLRINFINSSNNHIILGTPLFKEYLVSFNLQKGINSIYKIDRNYIISLQTRNCHIFRAIYILSIFIFSFLLIKIYNWAIKSTNQRIII